MHFFGQYALFFLETVTLVAAILIVIMGIVAISTRNKRQEPILNVEKINEKYEDIQAQLREEILDKKALKAFKQSQKKEKKEKKQLEKKEQALTTIEKRRTYVLRFDGDIRASAVDNLREEISSILTIAEPKDEIVVLLESGGGTVHGYGLGASQLQRIRDKKIYLTVCIDKVAASGGYLMACVADQILAAPFAIIGSIGVVMQMPNFHRLLKKHNIDYEVLTSGEYKRTLTLFGENNDKGRKKCIEELEEVHHYFKQHIAAHRPKINMDEVSTGEHWLAKRAYELQLIDGMMTSDDYLMKSCQDNDVFDVSLEKKKTLAEKVSDAFYGTIHRLQQKVFS